MRSERTVLRVSRLKTLMIGGTVFSYVWYEPSLTHEQHR